MCLQSGQVKSSPRSQGQAGKGRKFSRRTRSPSRTRATFWAAAATFREEPTAGPRSGFLFHWKASQSARAFADKPKALPRTFGSLGKVLWVFFFLQYLHAQSSIRNNKCPKATSCLLAPTLRAKHPLRLPHSMGCTKEGDTEPSQPQQRSCTARYWSLSACCRAAARESALPAPGSRTLPCQITETIIMGTKRENQRRENKQARMNKGTGITGPWCSSQAITGQIVEDNESV